MRPYTICYLSTNAHGKIDGGFFGAKEAAKPLGEYRKRWIEMDCDATIYGSVTMALFADGYIDKLVKSKEVYQRVDYISNHHEKKHYLVIDPTGTVAYDSNTIEVKGRGIHDIIVVVTENISDDYLAYLHSLDISYIFSGKEELDVTIMMHKAYELFNIHTALLSGGGYTDYTFLEKGMIDEIKLLQIPVIDGDIDTHPSFIKYKDLGQKAIGLKLKEVEVIEDDALMITYLPKNIQE